MQMHAACPMDIEALSHLYLEPRRVTALQRKGYYQGRTYLGLSPTYLLWSSSTIVSTVSAAHAAPQVTSPWTTTVLRSSSFSPEAVMFRCGMCKSLARPDLRPQIGSNRLCLVLPRSIRQAPLLAGRSGVSQLGINYVIW